MKKYIATVMLSLCSILAANAMSYEMAREQALYLTDKMAYELNLNDEQYNYCYEINLDYLMSINTADDVYGPWLTYRNADLRNILYDWQYSLFIAADYFFHPVYWRRGAWYYPIYNRYAATYYFYSRPRVFIDYRGGHGRLHYRNSFYLNRPHWNGGFRGMERGRIEHRGGMHYSAGRGAATINHSGPASRGAAYDNNRGMDHNHGTMNQNHDNGGRTVYGRSRNGYTIGQSRSAEPTSRMAGREGQTVHGTGSYDRPSSTRNLSAGTAPSVARGSSSAYSGGTSRSSAYSGGNNVSRSANYGGDTGYSSARSSSSYGSSRSASSMGSTRSSYGGGSAVTSSRGSSSAAGSRGSSSFSGGSSRGGSFSGGATRSGGSGSSRGGRGGR